MQKLAGKIVFITGASAGIGKATAEQFAMLGAKLILIARRQDRLEELASELRQKYHVEIYVASFDIQNREQVESVIRELPPEWQAIDILINNAGLALNLDKLQVGDISAWETMLDTNVKGLLYVTRAILPGMIERHQGHIINLGSIAGRDYYTNGAVYCATKHAVRAISKALRLDVLGTGIRVSEIAPGAVNTEFSLVRFQGDKQRADDVYRGFQPLLAEDVAETIIFCATRPPHVNVSELEVMATAQASVTQISRSLD